jgi:hypothetical protein
MKRSQLLLLGVVLVAGCSTLDSLIDVDAADRIVGETLETPENAPVLIAGMVGDFECALTNYIQAAGLAADEYMVTDGLTAQELPDKRQFDTRGLGSSYGTSTCSTLVEGARGVYRPLSIARWQADNLLRLLDGWTDQEVANRKLLIAKSAAYAGYSYLLLGESMCEAAFDLGSRKTPAEILALAEDRFTRAITTATEVGSNEFLTLARVGRARTRLDLGRSSDAAADAVLVPAGFVKNAVYSSTSTRRENAVGVDALGNLLTVDPQFRQVQFQGVADPRVPVVNTGRVVAGVNLEVWAQTKYPGRIAPIPIARYAEAQLILAEAALDAGNLQQAVDIINALHARPGVGLPQFNSTDPNVIRDQLLYERKAELFLEGQRFGDIRRYNLPLIPVPGTPHHDGGTYLDARCYPLPAIETDNNPNAR